MEKLVITGGKRLNGDVFISGAKNAAVAIIPAAIMSGGVCIIENLPNIEDVASLRSTLNKMGAVCEYVDKHTLKIDSSGNINTSAVFEEVRKIRASYYLSRSFASENIKKQRLQCPAAVTSEHVR